MEKWKMENFKKVLFEKTIEAHKDMDFFDELQNVGGVAGQRNYARASASWMVLKELIQDLGLDGEYFKYKREHNK